MEKKWRVSNVELLEGGLLFGFALYDQKRACRAFHSDTRPKPKLLQAVITWWRR